MQRGGKAMAYRWTEDDLARATRQQLSPSRAGLGVASSKVPKRSKYLNEKTIGRDGVIHDAKGECQRYEDLKLMERAGEIRNLRRQVVYALVVNGRLITTYKADFVYEDGAATVVEDRKSPRTRKLESFRHKVKLMEALHGIEIRIV